MQNLLHTPDGVRDIYGAECHQKLMLQERLHAVIQSYGYHDIETPTFEFFEVFDSEVGTTPSTDLYKFFDRDGNTLVLRPDFTPPVARAAAKYFPDDQMALRLSYLGNTFINSSSYQGRLKETTQIGGELIGDDSADADAEVIALTVQMLLSSGLTEFQISLGHCGFFNALAKEAALDAQDTDLIRELISNKNTFAVEKLLSEKRLDAAQKSALSALPGLFGDLSVLERAKTLTKNAQALSALERLEKIYEILTIYGVEKYVTFDLGLLSPYSYYTGILFHGYTFGTGAAILKGGRYDCLLSHFGKNAPAVGFVAEIDQLQSALSRQKITQKDCGRTCMILYEEEKTAEAIARANALRSEGYDTELVRITPERSREDCRAYAGSADCVRIIEL